MGAGGAKGRLDEQSLAQQYKLTPEQIHALVNAFRLGANSKTEINKERFIEVVKLVRGTNPELASFDDEVSGLVFTLCDTDHSGKVDPLEVIAALSVFARGDNPEKAMLVFKSIDKNNNGSLSKEEIYKHACKVLSFATRIVKADMKEAGKAAGLGVVGSVAASAISTGLSAAEKKFASDIVTEVFTLDRTNTGKITLEQWLIGVAYNSTIQALVDPNLSANAWRTVINPEDGFDSIQVLDEVARHPKGFAHIFDLEIESGRFKPTGGMPSAAIAAPVGFNYGAVNNAAVQQTYSVPAATEAAMPKPVNANISSSDNHFANYTMAPAAPAPECIVCCDALATHVAKECGHRCACERCAAKLSSCPICRKQTGFVRLFDP